MSFLGSEAHSITLPQVALLGNDFGGVLSLPSIQLTAFDADGYAEITLPQVTLTADWLLSTVGETAIELPAIRLSASGVVGAIGVGDTAFPNIRLSVDGWSASVGNLVLPQIELTAQGGELVIWSATIQVPMIEVYGSWAATESLTDYTVYVVNANTGAHSTYANFNCFGIFKFNGVWMGLFSDGVYELTGDFDGASTLIESEIQWAQSDLGFAQEKQVDCIYASMRNFGETAVKFTVKVDETEERTFTKDMTGHPEGMRRHRKLLPRGLKGNNWQFGIKNIDGGNFAITELEVQSNTLKRHSR